MASQINTPTTFLRSVLPSGIGGNSSAYQEKINGGKRAQRGGQGYGYEGKMIAPGVAEVSSYKGGKSKRRSNRRQQRKSKRRQNKSRRR
jgi:hypothetical protein